MLLTASPRGITGLRLIITHRRRLIVLGAFVVVVSSHCHLHLHLLLLGQKAWLSVVVVEVLLLLLDGIVVRTLRFEAGVQVGVRLIHTVEATFYQTLVLQVPASSVALESLICILLLSQEPDSRQILRRD